MCVFCDIPEDRIIDQNEHAFVIRDAYPVTDKHTLIITKRHQGNFFTLYEKERQALYRLLHKHHDILLEEDETISCFNVGINNGPEAGQTVSHCHVHLIPRRVADMDDPRGGVRGVIPDKQKY